MITKITGQLNLLLDDRARVQVGPLEYELLVGDATRAQLQSRVGQEVTLHTSHYLEAGAMQSRIVPRLLGFLGEVELEFFELFCTVDKIGVRKALKAMARPVREIAEAIHRQDQKYLATLPGIGGTTAEKIISTLRKKVAKFCLLRDPGQPNLALPAEESLAAAAVSGLIGLGHSPAEAHALVDRACGRGKRFESLEELFAAVYEQR